MGNKGSKGEKGAKKEKKGKGKKVAAAFKKLERKAFKTTNLPNIDDFFSKIQEPMDTLGSFSEAVGSANEALELLLTAEEIVGKCEKTVKAVLKYALGEAKKDGTDFKFTVGDDGSPSIETKEEPKGFVAKAYKAIKSLIDAIKEVIEKAPELVNQIKEAGESSKDLPENAKNDATSAGMNPFDAAKALKSVGDNIKYLGGFPNDVLEFINNCKDFVKMLKEVFSGEGEGEGEGKGEGEKKEKKEKKEGEEKEEKEEGEDKEE